MSNSVNDKSLLAVYGKLRGVGAAMCVDEDQQNELVEQARGLMLDICNDHVFAAEAFIKDNGLRETLIQKIRDECQELVEYIVAAKRFNLEINSRAKDRVISFGEKLSCRFMASLLQDMVSFLPYPAVSWPCLRELAVPFWIISTYARLVSVCEMPRVDVVKTTSGITGISLMQLIHSE